MVTYQDKSGNKVSALIITSKITTTDALAWVKEHGNGYASFFVQHSAAIMLKGEGGKSTGVSTGESMGNTGKGYGLITDPKKQSVIVYDAAENNYSIITKSEFDASYNKVEEAEAQKEQPKDSQEPTMEQLQGVANTTAEAYKAAQEAYTKSIPAGKTKGDNKLFQAMNKAKEAMDDAQFDLEEAQGKS